MNRRKISAMLAVALITSQIQNIASAETITNNQEVESVNGVVLENVDDNNSDSILNDITDTEGEVAPEEGSENSDDVNIKIEDAVSGDESQGNQGQGSEESRGTESDTDGEEGSSTQYTVTGKLELDLNFSMPIKVTTKEKTNISVTLKNSSNNVVGTIQLGSDTTPEKIEGGDITYSLEALNSMRKSLEEGETELSFYHLTFDKLPLDTYSIEISGSGYTNTTIDNIEIQKTSKRVLVGTSDNEIVDDKGTEDTKDDTKEQYLGAFLVGNLNDDNVVNETDYNILKEAIKDKSKNAEYDLNRDGKVDITDLTYIHQNMDKSQAQATVIDTDAIINPENVKIEVNAKPIEGDIKDILKDTDSVVKLQSEEDISEKNPIEIPINLSGLSRSSDGVAVEAINIQAPSENAPSSGQIVIEGAGENGQDLVVDFSEKNNDSNVSTLSTDGTTDTIKIDLGKQVAVSKITIKITGSKSNKNLAEIAKVEFLNNVYKEAPKPKMNIPVISSFESTTQVGKESMTIGWEHETNVTGYEIKVEKLNSNNNVVSTSYYKTSKNSLRIEKVEAYGIYRISIQSLSGDWKSGYKDEQEGYDAEETGTTNLANNKNDKDGKPDNVDSDYNPQSWTSNDGKLTDGKDTAVDGVANFGKDSIIEVQVIPETEPEGPEGITVKGGYRELTVSWKAHAKAKDYELYYRKVGTKEWLKANDNGEKYVDSNTEDNIPTGAANLKPGVADSEDFIRSTSYTIKGLEDTSSYEIMMTATNHHGTGGLSQVYMGSTTKLVPPKTTNYKLINTANGTNEITNHIESIEYKKGYWTESNDDVVDNDYSTYWVHWDWDTATYGHTGPVVTFDDEYTMDTIRVIKGLDTDMNPYYSNIGYLDEKTGEWKYVDASVSKSDNNRVTTLKLSEPITAKKVQVNLSSYTRVIAISEMKFYHYDSLQNEVDNLFADDLQLSINEHVNQTLIDDLTSRAKTIDPVSLEYHPNQKKILEDLQRAQDLLDEISLSDEIITLDSSIYNLNNSSNPQNTIGQTNDYQALGVAVKPGDKVTIYIGSDRTDTKFNLALTQFNAESGTAIKVIGELKVGKNEIEIPRTDFDMNFENGGNLYINFKSGYADHNTFRVRVSGGVEIPHLNVNNIIDDPNKEDEVKEKIRTYIKELKSYVSSLPNRYPSTATSEDNSNNIYTYDPKTSILNATDIEGERIMLSLAADQVLAGIQSGLSGDEEAQVDRLYNTLLAWEQLMKVSYSQQGLLEKGIDFDGDGSITDKAQTVLDGKSEKQYYNENRAPKNRMNIKYQRMFTGAFMYASNHHVGIGYSSIAGTMTGVPFEFDSNGELVNSSEGDLFGWGISHEIGHVHDINGLTYTETTNNILALITQTFNDENSSRLEGGYKAIYDKVTSNSVGLASDVFTRLGMFWQLHLAYDNDYTYKMLDINTDTDPNNDTFFAKLYRITRLKKTAPNEKGYDATAQTFIMRASDAAGKDLREFFAKWGLVSSPNTDAYLDSMNYEKEDKAIYYLNDETRRLRLEAGSNTSKLSMADDTTVVAEFGADDLGNKIGNRSFLNQKNVPLTLSVTKDADKILGYEIIRKEATSNGTQEVVVGFVERDKSGENGLTNYIDEIDAVNNRTFEYKVKAYDYNLNVTEETTIGTVKVNHDGSIVKSNWVFDTNTRSHEDESDEHSGHGQVQNGSIKKINDNDTSTIYTASKATNNNGNVVSGDPYVTIDLGDSKSVIGLKYNPGQVETKKFSLKNLFGRSSEIEYSPITKYEVHVSEDGKSWTKAHSGTFEKGKENIIYFNETGSNLNTQLWAYNAQYVKLTAVGANAISIAEIDILGPTGDNIEIGTDNDDNNYKNGIGKLKSPYTYAEGQVIPAGSIIITGEYKGDPAFNIPLVLNEENENLSSEASVLLFAEVPKDSPLGEVAKGTWLYYITPDEQKTANITGTKVKAELYRYNKLDGDTPIGQRLVSDTFLYDFDIDNLPEIELSDSKARTLSVDSNNVTQINNDMIKNVFKNRK